MLGAALAEFISKREPGSRMHAAGTDMLRAHGRNQDRRAAVLKHPDLAKRLATILGLRDARHWTGYIPPAVAIDDEGGVLRLITTTRNGGQHAYFNHANLRSCGEVLNTSPERTELVEISREAWDREQAQCQGELS